LGITSLTPSLRGAVPHDEERLLLLRHRRDAEADAGRDQAMDGVDLFLQHQAPEPFDRVLWVGLLLDHQLELAARDPAFLVHALRRPLNGADAALACGAGGTRARRENADLQWLVLRNRRREKRRHRGRGDADAGQLREGTTGVLHGIPPKSTNLRLCRAHLPYHRYIRNISASAFCLQKQDCLPNRLVICQDHAAPRTAERRRRRMEITTSPMTDRQRQYRATYRERIAGWYNGWLHVFVIYVIGLTALFIYGANIESPRWWEWLIVPITFLAANFFEWWIHRYVMHRPINIKGLRAVYERHTLNHHQFFTDEEMRFRDHKDWRVTVFPPYALVVFILMSIPGGLILGHLFSANVGWLFMCTTTGMYLIYEFMHFCCHVDENWFVRNCPFVNTLRRHHTAHHNARLMMEVNMNLTFPIADWFFGTSDLKRGLVGHVFNGYSTRFVRQDMRRTSRTPRPSATVQAGSIAPAE
jgi:hypothetical protein